MAGMVDVEICGDTSSAESPKLDDNPALQNHHSQPIQEYQPPPIRNGHQVPSVEPHSIQVVIERQPQKNQVITSHYTNETPNSYIVFSITCLVFTVLCGWPLLVCTIPAMFLSILSKARADKGDIQYANDYGRCAFGLNMTAVVGFAVLFLGVIIFEVVVNST